MTAQELAARLRALEGQIEDDRQRLAALRLRLEAPTGSNFCERVAGGGRQDDPLPARLDQIDRQKAALIAHCNQAAACRRALRRAIEEEAATGRDAAFLRLRLVENRRIDEISRRLRLSERQVYRLQKKWRQKTGSPNAAGKGRKPDET